MKHVDLSTESGDVVPHFLGNYSGTLAPIN